MEDERKEQRRKMAKVVAKAWSDESFKERLRTEPKAVLEEHGIAVPPGLEVKVLEQTDKLMYVVLPFKAEDTEGGSWMCEDDAYDMPCARCN
jgi:hypothetical protein